MCCCKEGLSSTCALRVRETWGKATFERAALRTHYAQQLSSEHLYSNHLLLQQLPLIICNCWEEFQLSTASTGKFHAFNVCKVAAIPDICCYHIYHINHVALNGHWMWSPIKAAKFCRTTPLISYSSLVCRSYVLMNIVATCHFTRHRHGAWYLNKLLQIANITFLEETIFNEVIYWIWDNILPAEFK